MRLIEAICTIVFIPVFAFPATIFVPDNYAKIQDAINASVNGDTIIVRPGTYVENLDFVGKAITVEGEFGPAVTTIDGNQAASVVVFHRGESELSVIKGFTITNGSGTASGSYLCGGGVFCDSSSPTITCNTITENKIGSYGSRGGGIFCDTSSPTISNNAIMKNSCYSYGGGICCRPSSSPTITNNTITGNSARLQGGGIYCNSYCFPVIINNTITSNLVTSTTASGGGVYCQTYSSPILTNNTIVGNSAVHAGGAISCKSSSSPIITNTILWNNISPTRQIYTSNSNPVVTYCDVEGGWSGFGNINADPLFVDYVSNDFHITMNSPCHNAGTNSAVTDPVDFEGDPRIAIGTADIGADEFYPHLYYAGQISSSSSVSIRVAGWPGAWVWLVRGSGVIDPPTPTKYGDVYMQQPFVNTWVLGNIPTDGVLRVPTKIPTHWVPGEQYVYQAMIGPAAPYPAMLTNHVVAKVK